LGDVKAARTDLEQASATFRKRGDEGLAPLLAKALGEVMFETGDLKEARARFAEAAAAWKQDLVDAASVESRAYLGLIEAMQGAPARGRPALVASLKQAREMGRLALEARCLIFLARLDLIERRPDNALRDLAQIPSDDEARTIGHDLRAQVDHWRAEALAQRGGSQLIAK
jgi:predicted negative regulator of RcsB-dependent stress response